MNNKVKIAVDAMGGENAPRKIIKGINISVRSLDIFVFISLI